MHTRLELEAGMTDSEKSVMQATFDREAIRIVHLSRLPRLNTVQHVYHEVGIVVRLFEEIEWELGLVSKVSIVWFLILYDMDLMVITPL